MLASDEHSTAFISAADARKDHGVAAAEEVDKSREVKVFDESIEIDAKPVFNTLAQPGDSALRVAKQKSQGQSPEKLLTD